MRRALAGGLLLGACFQGHGLWGERCAGDDECGPGLSCQDDGVCAEVPACETLELASADLRPRAVLLLDHSLSMQRCLDDELELDDCTSVGWPAPSRWDALGELVAAVVGEVGDAVAFAAVLFPSDDRPELLDSEQMCRFNDSTAIGFGEAATAAIVAAVPSDSERLPLGENPAREAWKLARDMLQGSVGAVVPPRRIVLVTDNPPNCQSGATERKALVEELDPEFARLVEEGAAAGIATIVVGISIKEEGDADFAIGGVDPHAYLSALAAAGGAAQPGETPYLHLADAASLPAVKGALAAALAGLADGEEACRVHLAEPLTEPHLVAVGLPGRLRRADPDCSDTQGWRWSDTSTLELCPRLCADVSAGARVRVRVDCG